MVTRKDAIKKLSAIGSATLLVGTMIMGTSITAYADIPNTNPSDGIISNIPKDEILADNYGYVCENNGIVNENHENGTIDLNSESGIVLINDIIGRVSYNRGDVQDNYGEVDNNYGHVEYNYEDAQVNTNYGVVTNNDGEIISNVGKVEINNDLITTNIGKTEKNNDTITTNLGIVVVNYGDIEENIGLVEDNQGSIIYNYSQGGDGIRKGKAAEHQYWYVTIDGSWDNQGIDVSFAEDDGFVQNKYYDDDYYLEQDTDKQGTIRISPKEEGYKVTLGDGVQSVTTCQVALVQDGNDYLVKISSITGASKLTLAQLNLVVQAIQQEGGGASGGSNITVVLDDSVSLATDDGGSSGESVQNAITVSMPIANAYAAIGTNGPSVLGANRGPSRSLSFKMSAITDAEYKNAVIANIGATAPGGVLRIQTDTIACFDRAMLEAFAKRGDITMEVLFPVGKTMMKVTIPAGTDINNLLDNKGYCGFLHLLAIIGGEAVTR